MNELEGNLVRAGNYVIIQKQNFRKLCKVSENGTFTMGKEQVEMRGLIGKPYWTTFQMVQSQKNRKTFALEVAKRAETAKELCKDISSGTDNRSITDDGTSQKLSKEDIEGLRDSGKSSNEIVGRLIENSKSFAAKTEYSQEKYIKKKERKYYRYLTIRRPSVDLLQEIYFRQDYSRINCLRMDTLAQILSYCDVKSEGTYMLYDSGSMGLPASAVMNRIGAGTDGVLVHLHPGNQAQTTLIQAMNYPNEQLERSLTVNLYSFLRLHHQGESAIMEEIAGKDSQSVSSGRTNGTSSPVVKAEAADNLKKSEKEETTKFEEKEKETAKLNEEKDERTKLEDEKKERAKLEDEKEENITESKNCLKRKLSDEQTPTVEAKRPKWLLETRKAVDRCKESKVDGLVVIAKEHPLNIAEALLPFLGASRPFVIYHCYREPLQDTYVALKKRGDVVNLKLLTNFLRSYQVLPNRTHPDILTNDLGGYLLTGYLVE